MIFLHTERRPRRVRVGHAASLGLLLMVGSAREAAAQTTAPGAAAGTGAGGVGASAPGVGASAPGANAPAPGVSSGVPAPAPGRSLTLADVVNRAVGSNSGLVLAQQRLQKAQELINQVNAQNRPQLSASANDTYTSYRAFPPTLTSPTVTNPVLPGGGQIPTVVDQAGGFSTAFIGGGGGGNAPSTGATLSTPGLGGTPTGGVGSTPGIGSAGPAGPSTPSVGGSGPSVGGSNTPGVTAPSAPPAPLGGAPAAPPPGTATPATPSTAPGVGATPSGAALLSVPEIVAYYVADARSLTQPPAPIVDAPKITVSHAAANPDAEEAALPRDASGGGGSAGNGSSGTTSTVNGLGGGSVGQRNTAASRVNVSQFVDLFGLVPAARDAQKDVRDFYALDITRLQNETALAAKNLFFNVLFAQAQVATEQQQVNYAQENVRITQARLRQGIVSRFDVLTAQTSLAAAQQQLIAAQDQFDLTNSSLSYLLGTDPDQTLTLEPPPLPPLNQAVDLPLSTRVALRQRPELGQAATNIKEAQRLIKLAGSTLLPTVGIVGSGEYNSIASTQTPRSYALISAELAVPLDDGGATRSRVRSARLDLQTQNLTLEQFQLTVSLEVRQADINVRNAQAQVGAASTGVTQAQEAVRLAYDRYQAGIGTFLDVLNALAELAATRTNLANAQFFYQTSLAQLVRALGGR